MIASASQNTTARAAQEDAAETTYTAREMNHMSDSPTAARVRPDIITDQFLSPLRQHGVVKAYLFGSVARDEERPDSDIDLLVTFDHDAPFIEELSLADALLQVSGGEIDLTTQLHPVFSPCITSTVVALPL
jgi:predicted nucleotidyltransferase